MKTSEKKTVSIDKTKSSEVSTNEKKDVEVSEPPTSAGGEAVLEEDSDAEIVI